MPVTVKVNNLSLVHRGSDGVSRATLPDVCKTPPGMVPVAYGNTTYSKDLVSGTATVSADGGNMIAVYGSVFTPSIGDEPGVGGGVISGVNMKESSWMTFSMDVKLEGRNACRLTDKKFHNRFNTVNAAGEMQADPEKKRPCDWENEDGAIVGAAPEGSTCACAPNGPPFIPDNCENVTALKKVVFVNGIKNDDDDHCGTLKKIMERRGCISLMGVYNKTDGFLKDLKQCILDKLGLGDNPAVDTLSKMAREHFAANQPLEIMAHSQGALITSRAINDAMNGVAADLFGTGTAASGSWSNITVNTYGGAAWTYPEGPQYSHTVNVFDPVPMLFGKGAGVLAPLIGTLVGGGVGALVGAAVGILSMAKDVTLIADLASALPLNHSFDDLYLKKVPREPCICRAATPP